MRLLIALFSSFLISTQVQSAPTTQEISLKLATEFVIPTYEKLAQSAIEQEKAWAKSCSKDDVQPAFHDFSDHWMQAQFMKFGPISSLLRYDRLYHWPERRNAVSKGLTGLKKSQDLEKLKAENFSFLSIAVQGLPALERIIFQKDDINEWDCQVARAVVANLSQITNETLKEWNDLLPIIQKGGDHPIYFESMDEVVARLFTEMISTFQMITDLKLLPVLGSDLEKANGKRAEMWRSDRSKTNIVNNVAAISRFSKVLLPYLPAAEQKSINDQLLSFEQKAKNLPASIKDGVHDEQGRFYMRHFIQECKTIRDLLIAQFTKHLDLTIGFNSMDGD